MSPRKPDISFGEFVIDRSARCLYRNGKRVAIQHRPLDVLVYLAIHHHRLVTREELLREFWPRAVNDEALTRCVSTIRKQLGDLRDPPTYIETYWGQGYHFIAKVDELPRDADIDTDAEPRGGVPARIRLRAPKRWLPAGLAIAALLAVWASFMVRDPPEPDFRGIDRIAVLPITAPGEEEWFSGAMTDQLIETISRIEGVTVVARGSVSLFSEQSDPQEIGNKLNVRAALTSRFRRTDDSAHLSSALVSTQDGSVIWNYQALEQPGSTEEEQIINLADAVARRLWANLRLRNARQPVSPVAYRHYLRGRYYWSQRSGTGLSRAIDSFEEALEVEPEYAAALASMADAWLLLPLYRAVEPTDAIPRAREAAERALRIDPDLAHAHAVLGVIAMSFDWDWERAETHLRNAVNLNPNDPVAIQRLGELYCYTARFEECRRYYAEALGLDPLSPIVRMLQGSPAMYSGHFDEAVALYLQARKEIPDFKFLEIALGHAYVGLGNWERAIQSYESLLPDFGLAIVGGPLIYARAKNGDERFALALLAELDLLNESEYVPPSKLALAHLGLGDPSTALEYLNEAIAVHDDRLVYLAVDHLFVDLHSHPEFAQVVRALNIDEIMQRRWYGSPGSVPGSPD